MSDNQGNTKIDDEQPDTNEFVVPCFRHKWAVVCLTEQTNKLIVCYHCEHCLALTTRRYNK